MLAYSTVTKIHTILYNLPLEEIKQKYSAVHHNIVELRALNKKTMVAAFSSMFWLVAGVTLFAAFDAKSNEEQSWLNTFKTKYPNAFKVADGAVIVGSAIIALYPLCKMMQLSKASGRERREVIRFLFRNNLLDF